MHLWLLIFYKLSHPKSLCRILQYIVSKLPSTLAELNALTESDRRAIADLKGYVSASNGDLEGLRASLNLINRPHPEHPTVELVRKVVQKGHLNIVRYFTANNAENMYPDWTWDWPTYITDAAEYNQSTVLQYLLAHSETIENATSMNIGTAMLVAAQNNVQESLAILISFFKGHKDFPTYLRQAYQTAAYHGAEQALHILMPYVPIDMLYKVFVYAIKGGQKRLVEKLLRTITMSGIDLHKAAFVTAAHFGQWEIMQSLLFHSNAHLLKDIVRTTGTPPIITHTAAQQLWLHGF